MPAVQAEPRGHQHREERENEQINRRRRDEKIASPVGSCGGHWRFNSDSIRDAVRPATCGTGSSPLSRSSIISRPRSSTSSYRSTFDPQGFFANFTSSRKASSTAVPAKDRATLIL